MISLKTLGFAAAFSAAVALGGAARAQQIESKVPQRQTWTFGGPFGYYDQEQLQRGFEVFRTVCSNCHSANLLAFRNLSQPGGPAFTEGQVKALAAEYQVQDGPNDEGKMFQRPGRAADHWVPAYPNPEAAKATIGAAPPDMSVLAKARSYSRGFPWFLIDALTQYQEQGPDYIYAIVAEGYSDPNDPNHNDYFPGGHIGMPNPLSDGQVEYTDGTPKTVQNYTKDVASFLMWMAEPNLEVRKKTGFRVMIFLIVFAGLLYFTKRKIWAEAH